jgi:hypothetical protein
MMKPLTALTAITILGALAAASTVTPSIFRPVAAVAAPPAVTIRVEELQRQVDVRALLITEIENLY